MLKDMYKTFVESASGIDGFKIGSKEDVPYDIDTLANGYVEARNNNDTIKMNQYISALMIRYWHMVPYLYESSKTLRVEMEDMVCWIYEALEKAFKYCSWLDESKPISKSSKGAEKCINQCITSVRQWWFKHLNQDKRKINAMVGSLDEPVNDSCSNSLIDIMESDDDISRNASVDYLVNHFIEDGELFNALVIDGIINQDTFRTKKITTDENETEVEEFSSIMLSKHLRSLDKDFIDYFESSYCVSRDDLEREVNRINSCSKVKLRNEIAKSLLSMRENEEVLQLVCC